ncbi:hypothetical protein N9F53_00355, partial [Bacteroidia bacterium]|nr:hypothetical protein [Bacteroidia bacterium]
MKKTITLLLLLFVGTSVHAQLKVETITYTVLASAQKDSIVSDLGDTAQTKEPKYIGGSPLLIRKLNESLKFDTWKKKKAGMYTAHITQNWESITVTTTNKKAKDSDLVAMGPALKKTAPLWSSYTVGDTAILPYCGIL